MLLNPKSLDHLRSHVLLSWLGVYVFNIALFLIVSIQFKDYSLSDVEGYLSTHLADLTMVFAPSMLILVGLWFVPAPPDVKLTNGQSTVALALSWFFLLSISTVTLFAALETVNHCLQDSEGIRRCKNAYQALNLWQPVAFGPLLYIFGSLVGSGSKSAD